MMTMSGWDRQYVLTFSSCESCVVIVGWLLCFSCMYIYWATVGSCVEWRVAPNLLRGAEESTLLLRYGQNLKLTNWLTESIEQSLWKANNSLLSPEIPHILWSLCLQDTNTCHYLSPIASVHTLLSYLFTVYFSIILLFHGSYQFSPPKLYVFLFSPIHAACLSCAIILHLMAQVTFYEKYKS